MSANEYLVRLTCPPYIQHSGRPVLTTVPIRYPVDPFHLLRLIIIQNWVDLDAFRSRRLTYFVNPFSLTVCFSGRSDSGETDAVKTTKLENWYVSYDSGRIGSFRFILNICDENRLHIAMWNGSFRRKWWLLSNFIMVNGNWEAQCTSSISVFVFLL